MKKREISLDKADVTKAARIDRSVIKDSARTSQGFIRLPFYATRTGVFTYINPDGSLRRELRHPEDVFAPESLATLSNVPVTDDHPNVKDPSVMLIDRKNARNYIIGYTGDNIAPEGEYVAGVATIYEDEAIEKIEAGKQELSCGYECEREIVSGVYEGQAYDVRQRNIVYNHLALVTRGRAGSNVRLRLDSADAVQVDNNDLGGIEMVKIVINGVTYEVSQAVADAWNAGQTTIADLQKAANDSKASVDSEKARADRAEARADSLQTELTAAKRDLAARNDSGDVEKIRAATKASLRIHKIAEKVLPSEKIATLDSMSDHDIQVEVIKTRQAEAILDGKSAPYIEARFDSIAETIEANGKKRDDQNQQGGSNVRDNRNQPVNLDEAEAETEKARQRQRENALNAHKN